MFSGVGFFLSLETESFAMDGAIWGSIGVCVTIIITSLLGMRHLGRMEATLNTVSDRSKQHDSEFRDVKKELKKVTDSVVDHASDCDKERKLNSTAIESAQKVMHDHENRLRQAGA